MRAAREQQRGHGNPNARLETNKKKVKPLQYEGQSLPIGF